MTRQEWRSLLEQLPIKNPTPEDMARFCPHLNMQEAVNAFTTGSGFVACPPLRISHGFQLISYRGKLAKDPRNPATRDHPPELSWSYAGRIPDGRPYNGSGEGYIYTDRAIQFARGNWPEYLIVDPSWKSALTIYVEDPADLIREGIFKDEPRTTAVLWVMLDCELEGMYSHQQTKSELLDRAIGEMTLDDYIGHEITGNRGSGRLYNCAYCASGLGLTGCPGCGHNFRGGGGRGGWNTPLSRKMVAYLQNSGHRFKQNTEVVWAAERKRFQHDKRTERESAEWTKMLADQ